MHIPFLSSLAHRIGIDLGSARTRIWSDKEGLVIDEPTCIAVDERTKKVLAVGTEAAAMAGRVSEYITIYYPVQHGQLQDFEVGRAMIKVFLQKVFHSPYFFRPTIMVSVPQTSTEANRQAVTDLMYAIGAREVFTISQPLASAIGAGVPIADASGTFLMQLGAGVVEAAVISLGSVVVGESSTYAGSYLDTKVKHMLREKKAIHLSESSSEAVKMQIGTVNDQSSIEMLVTGQDVVSASPQEIKIISAETQPVFMDIAAKYEQLLKKLLTQIPPELTVDIIDKGMLLAGGLSQLKGLDQYLVSRLGIPASVVENPQVTVIKGVQLALENLELFKESLGYNLGDHRG